MTDLQRLVDQLILHENFRLHPYVDTVGKITIGVGRNLSDKGISRTEGLLMLDNDIKEVVIDLTQNFPWFPHLDPIRQRVLMDMRFNLGPTRFRKFVSTLASVEAGRYADAALGMQNSKWHTDVGTRAMRLERMMETGLDYSTQNV